jgi:hypothetical protein
VREVAGDDAGERGFSEVGLNETLQSVYADISSDEARAVMSGGRI